MKLILERLKSQGVVIAVSFLYDEAENFYHRMQNLDYFEGKVVLVTGSARGIGFATARLLGTCGAKVVLSDILDDRLAQAEEQLKEAGIEVMAQKADVTIFEDCKALVKAALKKFGTLDILINNAGISIVDRFENCAPEVARNLFDVNIMGQVNMSLAALESLKESRGHIIFVSSVSGIRSIPTGSLYGASKAALRSLADAIRLELAPYGIHVGVIIPGFTTTDPEKTVMKGTGEPRPINRSPHDTPEGVAKGIAGLIENRDRERVLTRLGKLTSILQRLSPSLLDRLVAGREFKN
jgi:NAD(P)-dependent dehydrogenase (short-subunit alcohol dehydrogenase family)